MEKEKEKEGERWVSFQLKRGASPVRITLTLYKWRTPTYVKKKAFSIGNKTLLNILPWSQVENVTHSLKHLVPLPLNITDDIHLGRKAELVKGKISIECNYIVPNGF